MALNYKINFVKTLNPNQIVDIFSLVKKDKQLKEIKIHPSKINLKDQILCILYQDNLSSLEIQNIHGDHQEKDLFSYKQNKKLIIMSKPEYLCL